MVTDEREALRFPADGGCFGCSPTNPLGLRLTFHRAGNAVTTRHALAEHFCGAPGVAHGGMVATLLDEVSCAAVFFLRGHFVVTGELSVRYLKPCPIAQPLDLVARIVEERPKYLVVEAQVNAHGDLVARSSGRFFPQARAEAAP